MSFKRPESVLVVIYDHHQQVLLLQRLDDPEFWQSVTGTMEVQETPFDTALREVWEETGIDIIQQGYRLEDHQQINHYPIRSAWRYRYAPDITHNKEHVFSLKVDPGQSVMLTEHSAYQWLKMGQAAEKVWSQSNRQAILEWVRS
ncbi:dihydroneopterin triphosphate diphosphatase [Lacimicrobium alkaliphilum]|uniref:NUDIX pyrophosphatase n=1 Tax=Lacimicrobium alkaliphilum TaxID=1526571 RepID=A0ABQ1RIC4_9ALTE|nr:dihydroneopterin triphosphate diphosphatase [Lacimicrobium alkaliphilum]GGD68019.1 NUDIX pyrophosphatase [Lacimicrobium alkaliphilum]